MVVSLRVTGAHMLESLGLDALSERLYREMLAHPGEGVAELANRLGTTEPEIQRTLDRLSALTLIRPSDRENCGYHLLSPQMAMELLLARQEAQLAAEQAKAEAARAAATRLVAEYSALCVHAVEPASERLIGGDAIRDRLTRLGESTRSEVMTFMPGGGCPSRDGHPDRGASGKLLDRGVRLRTVYLDSVRNDKSALEHIGWLRSKGGEVRTAVSLPTHMIIIDRRQALLPVELSDARDGAVFVWSEATVTALCALFECVWAQATPLGGRPAPDARGLPRQEAEVLRLLANGLTDEAIAKRLGVSPRTARRVAAELMERLNARSRFEAGVHAVQRGWLPAER